MRAVSGRAPRPADYAPKLLQAPLAKPLSFGLSARAMPAGEAVASLLSLLPLVQFLVRTGKARSSSRPCKVGLSERPQPVKSGEAGTGPTRSHAQGVPPEHGEHGEDPPFDR
jgi:hypothetical protein